MSNPLDPQRTRLIIAATTIVLFFVGVFYVIYLIGQSQPK